MFFPESSSLTSLFPPNDVASIDSYLAQGAGKLFDAWKVSYHSGVEKAQVNNILSEYVRLNVVQEISVIECHQCSNLYELTGPNQSYCNECGIQLNNQADALKQSLQVNKEKMNCQNTSLLAQFPKGQELIIRDLQKAIKAKEVVFLVGAGASVAATQNDKNASWKGLLETGVDWCEQFSSPAVSEEWVDIIKKEVASKEVDLFLSAAEKISGKLGAVHELPRFFKENIGALTVKDSILLSSILAFDAPIMTTNYDDMFEKCSGLPIISWHQTNKVHDWIRNQREGVLHVHGHWDDPAEKIIFGTSSYAHITHDNGFEAMLNTIRGSRNIVYLCFGNSLDDPHFGAFFKWGAKIFQNTNSRHFKFCRRSDPALSQLEIDNRLVRVEYGSEYSDLAPFLDLILASIDQT